MKPSIKILALFCLLGLVMLACSVTVDLGSLPSSTPTRQLSSQDQLSTMVAQTLQAFTQAALSATPANTPLPTATGTAANTPVPPTLSVSVATNCYAGPRTNYGLVFTLRPGTVVTVSGKDTADNYWIIDVPNYPGTICWLSGQYAGISGDTSNLAEPATPVPSIYNLSEPTDLNVSCSKQTLSPTPTPGPGQWWQGDFQLTVYLHWRNTESDQLGVRIYRDGRRIATLGGYATSYTDVFFPFGWHRDDITYGVQAFNSSDVSNIVTIEVNNCR